MKKLWNRGVEAGFGKTERYRVILPCGSDHPSSKYKILFAGMLAEPVGFYEGIAEDEGYKEHVLFFNMCGQMHDLAFSGEVGKSLAGRNKWAFLNNFYDAAIDTTISTQQIVLQISMEPVQRFEIKLGQYRGHGKRQGWGVLLNELSTVVREKGYEFKRLPAAELQSALPAPVVEVEKSESFEGLITRVQNNIAFVTLADNDGNESFAEVPVEDLEKSGIEVGGGVIFSFILRQRGDWEKVELAPIKPTIMTDAEFDKLFEYYKDEYGDV